MALSDRQTRILGAIRRSLAARGYPPTVRELCSAVGISSTSVVNYNLKRLEEKGLLVRNPEVSRGITLLDGSFVARDAQVVDVPLLGRIAAGLPLPIPNSEFPAFAEETIALTRDILPDETDIYALEVRGNSMIDALINDGDIVIVRHQNVADNGDLVAVWLRDERETTLKRLYREGERIRLQPANPYMQPIYVAAEDVEVQGKVVLVIRQPERRRSSALELDRSSSPVPVR